MKYLVMECHLSYAVVLDEDGRFLNVANMHYEVGQTVTDVIELQAPQSVPRKKTTNRWAYSLAALAACLVLLVTSVLRLEQTAYASVYMSINPQLRIDVNRSDKVVGLDGVNTDGDELIEGYDYKRKALDLVMDELVDRAIDMGYLHEGGKISLVLDSDNDEWIVAHSDALTTHLSEYLSEKLTVTIDVTGETKAPQQATIPVAPGESGYDDSDYGITDSPALPPDTYTPDSEHSDSDYDDYDDDDGQSAYESESVDDSDVCSSEADSDYSYAETSPGQDSDYDDADDDDDDDDDNDDDDDDDFIEDSDYDSDGD